MHGHKHTIHKEHGHNGWDNSFKPVLTIAPGESVEFETRDASGGQLNPNSTAADVTKLDLGLVNPVTGPVYIDGAEPGDALKVTLLGFKPSGWGWTANIPGFGLLADQFPEFAKGPGTPPEGVTLHLQVEDADAAWERATAAGCEVIMPIDDQFWGDRYGQLKDPFGFEWSVASRSKG